MVSGCHHQQVTDTDSIRAEAERMVAALKSQAELTNPGEFAVDRARTRLVVALMELSDDPIYGELHADATVILDQLSDMLEDPALRLGW
jgi:hypothetical protein